MKTFSQKLLIGDVCIRHCDAMHDEHNGFGSVSIELTNNENEAKEKKHLFTFFTTCVPSLPKQQACIAVLSTCMPVAMLYPGRLTVSHVACCVSFIIHILHIWTASVLNILVAYIECRSNQVLKTQFWSLWDNFLHQIVHVYIFSGTFTKFGWYHNVSPVGYLSVTLVYCDKTSETGIPQFTTKYIALCFIMVLHFKF